MMDCYNHSFLLGQCAAGVWVQAWERWRRVKSPPLHLGEGRGKRDREKTEKYPERVQTLTMWSQCNCNLTIVQKYSKLWMTSNNCGSQSITISILSLVFIVLKELSGLCWRMNPSQQRCNQRVACWSAYLTLHPLPTSSTLPHSCSHLLWSVCLVSSLSADIRGQVVITKSLLKSSFHMSFVDWSPTVSANSVSFACLSVNEYLWTYQSSDSAVYFDLSDRAFDTTHSIP